MPKKLFELVIEREDGTVSGHIVASTENQAVHMVVDHDLGRGLEHIGFSLERIDNKLPEDRRHELNHALSGPPGFARYVEPGGWIVDQVLGDSLFLFRIFTPEGEETYVVAADENEAAAIYCASYTLADGETRLFKIVDGVDDLPPERLTNLDSILEFGPRGVAAWDQKHGWLVLPPE